MKKDFKMVAGWVMSVLGIQNFAKNEDGKLFLTDVQKKLLADKYGQVFVDSFTADLDRMEVEGNEVNLTLSAEEKLELEAWRPPACASAYSSWRQRRKPSRPPSTNWSTSPQVPTASR